MTKIGCYFGILKFDLKDIYKYQQITFKLPWYVLFWHFESVCFQAKDRFSFMVVQTVVVRFIFLKINITMYLNSGVKCIEINQSCSWFVR